MPRLIQEFLFLLVFALPAFVLPGIMGPLMMMHYRTDRISKMAGFFTLKPLLVTPLWALIYAVGDSSGIPFGISQVISWVPPVGIALILIWVFRGVFRVEPGIFILFLVTDALRWLNTLVGIGVAKSVEGAFTSFYLSSLILANAYPVMALAVLWLRARRSERARGIPA